MNLYAINIITDSRRDIDGNVLQNGRIHSMYPIIYTNNTPLTPDNILQDTRLMDAINERYLMSIPTDMMENTYMYVQCIRNGRSAQPFKVKVEHVDNQIKPQ